MIKMLLCDIDGTLISTSLTGNPTNNRFYYSLKEVFGIDPLYDREKYNGWTDYQILSDMIIPFGITQSDLDQKLNIIAEKMIEGIEKKGKAKDTFFVIPGVFDFLKKVDTLPIVKGIFTGNLKKVGKWKLRLNQIDSFFIFGLYGDYMLNKSEIMQKKLPEYTHYRHKEFANDNCCIIGDTAEDIKAGKFAGVKTIGVLTSVYTKKSELEAVRPDLIISSLLDPRVMQFLYT